MVGLCVCTIKTTLSPYRSARTIRWMCEACRKKAKRIRLAKEDETKRRHTLLRKSLPDFYCDPVKEYRPLKKQREKSK